MEKATKNIWTPVKMEVIKEEDVVHEIGNIRVVGNTSAKPAVVIPRKDVYRYVTPPRAPRGMRWTGFYFAPNFWMTWTEPIPEGYYDYRS